MIFQKSFYYQETFLIFYQCWKHDVKFFRILWVKIWVESLSFIVIGQIRIWQREKRMGSGKICNPGLERWMPKAQLHYMSVHMPIINILAVYQCSWSTHIFCMTIFYIPNPTQYLNLTTTLLTINEQQIRSLLRQKSWFGDGEKWTLK